MLFSVVFDSIELGGGPISIVYDNTDIGGWGGNSLSLSNSATHNPLLPLIY